MLIFFFPISPSDLRHRTIVLCRSELILIRHGNSILSYENNRDALVKSDQLFASITGTKADRNFGRRERLLWVLVASLGPSAECRARLELPLGSNASIQPNHGGASLPEFAGADRRNLESFAIAQSLEGTYLVYMVESRVEPAVHDSYQKLQSPIRKER